MGVTSFTVIYHCMKIQQAAKAETGVACEGSNQFAYQPSAVLISCSCPYKYQLCVKWHGLDQAIKQCGS
jgi:hypothetical protein